MEQTEISITYRLDQMGAKMMEMNTEANGFLYLSYKDYHDLIGLHHNQAANKVALPYTGESSFEHLIFGGKDFMIVKTLTDESYCHVINKGGYLIGKIDI